VFEFAVGAPEGSQVQLKSAADQPGRLQYNQIAVSANRLVGNVKEWAVHC
jgi:hypothetical protein